METDEIYAKLIAAEYAPKNSRKVIALKKLDRKAKRPALICAYLLGAIGIVILCAGICLLTLAVVGSTQICFIFGIVLLVLGCFILTYNCVLFGKLLECIKRRYAFDIVELAKDICGYDTYR